MLFLGTEPFPEAGEYQAYLSANGGRSNAYTTYDHTNYYFEVDGSKLEGALDRFAPFFSAPLFTADLVDRERNAVHSEYTAKIKEDGRRYFDALKQIINPEHPFPNLPSETWRPWLEMAPSWPRKFVNFGWTPTAPT